jgi:hypothetical protein
MKFKVNQIYLKQKKFKDVMSIHYQKNYYKKYIRVTTIWGGFNVLSP